ncbi:MAG: M23 family metallopeptidase [Clostridia bacterium]
MAEPISATTVVVKVVVTAVSDPKIRKVILWIIAAILSPIIIIVVFVVMLFSQTTEQANSIVEYVFNDEVLFENFSISTQSNIVNMRNCFLVIEENYAELAYDLDSEVDMDYVKSLFCALYYAKDYTATIYCETFIENFISDNSVITDLNIVYENIENNHGILVTETDISNAESIYNFVVYGISIPSAVFGITGFAEPVTDWESSVTSEFGYRYHPITGEWSGHGGIDIGKPYGTPIYAVLSGTVLISTYNSSYGNYVMIDHGDGIITVYAHCSALLVEVGCTVLTGQQIAEVGSTGSSTGNHLHFEVRVNGEKVEPRNYLP